MTLPGSRDLDALAARIRTCRICVEAPEGRPLPHQPRPVLRVSATARLLIAGQAPGVRVHASGLPFDDPSGERLRGWMGVDRAAFYDPSRIAIAAMGFCFPGHDSKGGDLPPRRECRAHWHDELFRLTPQVETILAVGRPAQDYHFARIGLAPPKGASLEQIVRWSANKLAENVDADAARAGLAASLLAKQCVAETPSLVRGAVRSADAPTRRRGAVAFSKST